MTGLRLPRLSISEWQSLSAIASCVMYDHTSSSGRYCLGQDACESRLGSHRTALSRPLDALVVPASLYDLRQVAALAVLHDDVEHVVGLVDEALKVAHNVVIVAELLEDVAVLTSPHLAVSSLFPLLRDRRSSHFLGELLEVALIHPAIVELLAGDHLWAGGRGSSDLSTHTESKYPRQARLTCLSALLVTLRMILFRFRGERSMSSRVRANNTPRWETKRARRESKKGLTQSCLCQ